MMLALVAALAQSLAQPVAQHEEDAPPPAPAPHAAAVSGSVLSPLAVRANFAEAMLDVAERQLVFDRASEAVTLSGRAAQGGLMFGETAPGSTVRLDGEPVMVGEDGRFVIGFGREHPASALLVVTLPGGSVERVALEIEKRDFPVQRIDGLDQSMVSGFTEEQLKKIAADREKKTAARAETHRLADWAGGFDWPATGRISGVFGSQRILNGEPKTPHSGLDIAAPTGAPVKAPAAGIVRLAEHGMYFEGGLVFLDHGHWLESAFLHLSRIDVVPGQRVEKGEIIGAIGATGRATGPHLHWSLKWGARLVDPFLVLPEQPAAAPAAGR